MAADLPPEAREACAAWRDEAVAGVPGLRAVPDASLHVTLAFLGERDDAEALAERLATCPRPVAGIGVAGVRLLPPRRPRVLALELSDARGELRRLHARVAAVLEHVDPRGLLPHVTVARFGRGARTPLAAPPAPSPAPFALSGLTLYRSHLGGGPARYEPLARWPL